MENVKEFRLIVAGSRTYEDREHIFSRLDKIVKDIKSGENEECMFTFISGGCRGVDAIGEAYAKEKGYALKIFPAQWEKYGKGAGPIRIEEMVTYAMQQESRLIAFWDGKSDGTRSLIACASAKGLPVQVEKHKRKLQTSN